MATIDAPVAADPHTGVLFVPSRTHCSTRIIAPGVERDAILDLPTGTTIADYAVLRSTGVRGPDGLSIYKPPYSRITAIDMNTGEHLWMIPTGETPAVVQNHPDLQGMDIPNTGVMMPAPIVVTKTLLMYTSAQSDGTPALFAVDKATGRQIGKVDVDGHTRYGNMTYVHDGQQYVVLQTGGKLTTLALPVE